MLQVRAANGAATARAGEPMHETIVAAFTEVAEALTEHRELDELLHLVAHKICDLTAIRRCSIHLRDPDSDLFRGRVGHADHDDLGEQIRRLQANLPADRFTKEIVDSRRPVLLRDARTDPRPIRATMRYWDVHSILGVPMIAHDEVIGLILLDNMEHPHPYSEAQQDLAATFANLAAAAIIQAQLTIDLRSSLKTVEQQNAALKRGALMEERLTALLLRGSGVRQTGAAVAALTNKPCVIYDAAFCEIARMGTDDEALPKLLEEDVRSAPAVEQALAQIDDGRSRVIGPLPSVGLRCRLLVTPVAVNEERWGYLTIVEHGSRLGHLDGVLSRRGAATIALEIGAQQRAAKTEWRSAESLVVAALRPDGDPKALQLQADARGVPLDAPRIVCLVSPRDPRRGSLDPRSLSDALNDLSIHGRVLVAEMSDDVAILLPVAPDATQAAAAGYARAVAREALETSVPEGGVLVAMSTRCLAAGELPRAFRESQQVMQCLSEHVTADTPQANALLTANDLGAGGRVFLSSTSNDRALEFVQDTLGPLLEDSARNRELLETLVTYLQCARGRRRTAATLGVHENTVRYRLLRIEELTGLAVTDDGDDQLTAQLALLVLRLSGSGLLPGVG